MGNLKIKIFYAIILLMVSSAIFAQNDYPDWACEMKVWPFDVLYPFDTAFAGINGEEKTSDADIRGKLDAAVNAGANVVIFYIDDEQSYETFVDENGFSQTLSRIQFLVGEAHNRNLKVVCYLNGLETISVGATTNQALPSLARNYPDWLQIDVTGEKMVWYTTEETEWIPENSEDAWASPLSPWRDFFKQRLISLANAGLDGVYIDATFLPGVDAFGIKWASSDPYFKDEFQDSYGLSIPSSVDWNSETWRKFVFFRHEVIRDYLGEMAEVARANGMTPFFESSSCDFKNGTFLANDVPFTISGDIACSPEIEPEGDFRAAFRMSKSTRDANQDFPMWFLGWPETAERAQREFSITLCHSGNYYPTADADFPANAFSFMDLLREPILSKRVPFQNAVLIYPMRSKDYSFESESAFGAYDGAFNELIRKHIPFRILPLETMTADDLTDVDVAVLAGAESISDEEFNLLKNKNVALVGENGTKDEWGTALSQPRQFPNAVDFASLAPNLPFDIQAPATSFIEFYVDKSDENHFFVFSYNDVNGGEITFETAEPTTVKFYEIDGGVSELSGTNISIPINDFLSVIELNLSGSSAINDNSNLSEEFQLSNYPNPFSKGSGGSSSTVIKFSIPLIETQNLASPRIILKVYNILGSEIATLVNKESLPGEYSIRFDASNLSAGIYFYRLQYGSKSLTKKMLLIR
ncbi:MAG: T9SS type A sorting domain-containing protein [Chlorobi bacterium]|nr:T9SS type A sorting domain-containing protein [Chlorobiota bacterium]